MTFHNQTSHTLPSSPDFQFTISLPPPTAPGPRLRPADELFYNGHLLPLPLHLPPHTSMAPNLLTRHSGDYHSSLFYKTSVADDRIPHNLLPFNSKMISHAKKPLITQQFSVNKFSSVFRKEPKADHSVSLTLRDKIRKYVKKISQFHGKKTARPMANTDDLIMSYSFTGNMRFLRKTSCVSSCPSTMPSSPNHCRKGVVKGYTSRSSSSSEDLQNAIEGAIAHCKNSMTR